MASRASSIALRITGSNGQNFIAAGMFLVATLGFVLIVALEALKVRGAVLIGILAVTVVSGETVLLTLGATRTSWLQRRLTGYERDGPPLRLRWGLYAGAGLYPGLRRRWRRPSCPLMMTCCGNGAASSSTWRCSRRRKSGGRPAVSGSHVIRAEAAAFISEPLAAVRLARERH